MASVNKIMLAGRLTRDPEIRPTATGLKMASFDIAVDRFGRSEGGEKKTDFFRCKAWRQKADFVEEYIKKGRMVFIEGRVELDKYTDRDGQTRNTFDVVVEQIQPLESARDQAGDAAPPSGGGSYDGGNRNGGGQQRYDDGGNGEGYFPDDEPAPARAPQRSAPVAAQSAPPQRAPQRPAAAAPPARKPATPAYDEDFDDSDPFADE
jgi:single-strand DNA-binding protein